jgi:hypothetical protein
MDDNRGEAVELDVGEWRYPEEGSKKRGRKPKTAQSFALTTFMKKGFFIGYFH